MDRSMGGKFVMRRLMLGAGLAMLIAGWGCTRYADAEMQAVTSGNDAVTVWAGEKTKVSSFVNGKKDGLGAKQLYQIGYLCMGIGTVVLVLTFPRGSWQGHP